MRASLLSAVWLRAAAPLSGVAFGVVVAGTIVLSSPDVAAESTYDSLYGYDRTWNAALRLIRVDMNLKILEKDEQSGYLLFEYTSSESGKLVSHGSVELVRPREADGPVHVIVQLPQMPRYHEQVILNQLTRKMKTEYGDPPLHKPAPPAPPPSDGGAD
jgi:hypothetical protein